VAGTMIKANNGVAYKTGQNLVSSAEHTGKQAP
jgi:hypothetical protein